jgi:hypothetical protein
MAQLFEKLSWLRLSHQIGHQICRFGTFSSPICGCYQLNADFFNTLGDYSTYYPAVAV